MKKAREVLGVLLEVGARNRVLLAQDTIPITHLDIDRRG